MAACSISNAGLLGNYGGIKSNRNDVRDWPHDVRLAMRQGGGIARGENCAVRCGAVRCDAMPLYHMWRRAWLAEKLGK